MSHDQQGPDDIGCSMVGGYATDALTDQERESFERHLTTCESCPTEVVTFHETLATLNLSVAAEPPPGLRDGVLAAIQNTRIEPPLPKPSAEPGRAGGPGISRAATFALSAAAALVIIMAIVTGVSLHQTQVAQQAASSAAAEQQARTEILSEPDVRAIAFRLDNGAHGVWYLSPATDRGLVIVSGLPDPGADRAYQLWTIHDGKPVPNAVLARGSTIQQTISGVTGAGAGAMTIEPVGGSLRPTSTPLVITKWN